MTFYSRKNPRAQRHDYTSNWIYFITINTQDREHYFWEIKNKKMILNQIWQICDNQIKIMTKKRLSIKINEYTIMPNHIHILLTIHVRKDDGLPRPDLPWHGEQDNANVYPYERAHITNQSLWSIIWWLKSAIIKKCNEQWLTFARQSRYHDNIVKDEKAYNNIKRYIQNNPKKWEEDMFF